MPPSNADRAAASGLADEVRAKTRSQLRTSRKLTTLLDRFDAYALTPEVRERVGRRSPTRGWSWTLPWRRPSARAGSS